MVIIGTKTYDEVLETAKLDTAVFEADAEYDADDQPQDAQYQVLEGGEGVAGSTKNHARILRSSVRSRRSMMSGAANIRRM